MQYRMFSDTELSNFRAWLRHCPFDRSAVLAAFDSARQGEEPEEPKARGNVLRFLKVCARGMSPESWAQFREELLDEPAEDDALPLRANGEPGKPETAQDREIAMDDYHRRFPHAPRGVRYEPELRQPVHMTAADARDYAKRFPESGRIGRA